MVGKHLPVIALFCVLSTAAYAENLITVEDLCRRLTAYQPSGDVNVKTDKPVDVQGRPVAPADLDGTTKLNLPDAIDVAITLDQAQQFGLPVGGPYTPQSYIGNVTVTKDGDAYFNGKRFSETQVQTLCSDKAKPLKPDEKPAVSYGTPPKDPESSSLRR